MFVRLGRSEVPAVFRPYLVRSVVPLESLRCLLATPATMSGLLSVPITVYSGSSSFTQVLDMMIANSKVVELGLDWFGGFRDHVIALRRQPPVAKDFDLSLFDLSSPVSLNDRTRFVHPVMDREYIHSRPCIENDARHNVYNPLPVPVSSGSSSHVSENMTSVHRMLFEHSSSVYVMDPSVHLRLAATLADHGVAAGTDYSVNQQLILHHLAYGLCGLRRSSACCSVAGDSSVATVRSSVYRMFTEVVSRKNLPDISVLRALCSSLGYRCRQAEFSDISEIMRSIRPLIFDEGCNITAIYLEKTTKVEALRFAAAHGVSAAGSIDEIQKIMFDHVVYGGCAGNTSVSGCQKFEAGVNPFSITLSSEETHARFLIHLSESLPIKPLRKALDQQGITYNSSDSLSKLRAFLKCQGRNLRKGKKKEEAALEAKQRTKLREEWPRQVNPELKAKLAAMFREETSSESLKTSTCASCSRSVMNRLLTSVPASAVDLSLFHCPQDVYYGNYSELGFPMSCMPFQDGPFKECLLDPGGISVDPDGRSMLSLCESCSSSVSRSCLPKHSMANHLFIGIVPDVLQNLTPMEESMIALCRAKNWIVQLKENDQNAPSVITQRGVRGHTIVYPQDPGPIAQILPPSIEDIVTPVCIIFVGSVQPSRAWLRDKAKPLVIRADRVRAALKWLKANNPLYSHITINYGVLDEIERTPFLPFHVEHIRPSIAQSTLQSRYDEPDESSNDIWPEHGSEPDLPFTNVVVADVNGMMSSNEMRAAAVRHITEKGGGYIQLPHLPTPVNEFNNPSLFPMIYPTLFPYGLGGLEDSKRKIKLSFKAHVEYLFSLNDRRFQEHYSFMFTAFNMIQRRAVLLHTSLKVKKNSFPDVASKFAAVKLDAVHRVCQRVANGEIASAKDDDEKKVLALMKEVNLVTSNVPGSAASHVTLRNEMRGLMMHLGLPSFFVTINPADVYNPVLKFLAGDDIDVDKLSSEEIPQYWDQACLVAKNPANAALFFNKYMKAFISCLLRYDPSQKDLEGGILGVTKGYYGCVEAQGRGTLHCHMFVWLEGALNPEEEKKKRRLLNPVPSSRGKSRSKYRKIGNCERMTTIDVANKGWPQPLFR